MHRVLDHIHVTVISELHNSLFQAFLSHIYTIHLPVILGPQRRHYCTIMPSHPITLMPRSRNSRGDPIRYVIKPDLPMYPAAKLFPSFPRLLYILNLLARPDLRVHANRID